MPSIANAKPRSTYSEVLKGEGAGLAHRPASGWFELILIA